MPPVRARRVVAAFAARAGGALRMRRRDGGCGTLGLPMIERMLTTDAERREIELSVHTPKFDVSWIAPEGAR